MSVYFVQRPGTRRRPDGSTWTPDLSSAEKYGNILFFFEAEQLPHKNPQHFLDWARRGADVFDFDSDYLAWASNSDPMALYLVLIAMMEQEPRQIKILVWDRNSQDRSKGCYIPITLQLRAY